MTGTPVSSSFLMAFSDVAVPSISPSWDESTRGMPSMHTISLTPICSRVSSMHMVRSYVCSGLGAISEVTTTRSLALTLLGFASTVFSAAPSTDLPSSSEVFGASPPSGKAVLSAEVSDAGADSALGFLFLFGLGTAPAYILMGG